MLNKIHQLFQQPKRIKWIFLSRFSRWTGIPIKQIVKLTTGSRMTIVLPDTLSTVAAYEGDFEPEVTNFMQRNLDEESVFFDVGAHFGLRTLQANDITFGKAKIIAFEPGREQLKILKENCRGLKNVTIIPKAVSESSNKHLYLTEFSTRFVGSSTLENPRLSRENLKKAFNNSKKYKVESITIDDYVTITKTVPTLIKIDVENHERAVLRGAKKTLKKYHPKLILEVGGVDEKALYSTHALQNYLVEYNYRFFIFQKGKLVTYKTSSKEENIIAQ